MKEKLRRFFAELPQRYRDIPEQIHSRSVKKRSKAQKLITATICIPLMLACIVYIIGWELNRNHIKQQNQSFSALYTGAATPGASFGPAESALPSPSPTARPETEAETTSASASPAAAETTSASASPAAVPETTAPAASVTPTVQPTATPRPTFEAALDATRKPVPTPDADTIVYAAETPPPVQESFNALLELNPETVGFLTIGERISLPVVQKKNDNEYYLNHSFDGHESDAGTLFLDGSNLLTPEDAALIIYGHNMRNGTMFQPLVHYEEMDFLKEHPLVRFDTIYENRSYIPFAAFTATLDTYSDHYLDVRQFMFTQSSFERYIERIQKLSLYDSPVDVAYGDNVLLLVTCEYLHDNGRFIVALREVRPEETEEQAIELVKQTKLKYSK